MLKPNLKIYTLLESSGSGNVKRYDESGFHRDAYYLRLKIINEGSAPAEDVEVVFDELDHKNKDGQFEKSHSFLPRNFIWSYTDQITMNKIKPHMPKYCNLGHLIPLNSIKPDLANMISSLKYSSIALFLADTQTLLGGNPLSIAPGEYRFKILIGGDNFQTITKWYAFSYKDEWSNDADSTFSNIIQLKEL